MCPKHRRTGAICSIGKGGKRRELGRSTLAKVVYTQLGILWGNSLMKKLIVCCDGTGNEIGENISNVLKFYRTLKKSESASPQQVVFYHPGVGTLARPNPWTKLWQDTKTVLGLATGYGLDDGVLTAYEFLIQNYEDGDEIYLFGFSRGAHTARVLAALIHLIGILYPQQMNLAGAALTAYKQSKERADELVQTKDDRAAQFARITSTRWPTIRFLGVWDTVASVIVPRPDRFYTFSLQILPYTRRNPSVKVFRQACSIDERRRMFRLEPWVPAQTYMKNRFSKTNNARPQDAKQVWFPGVHADVGGGYAETESGLSKFPLQWMIDEAKKQGLEFNTQSVNQLVWGHKRKGSPFDYVGPDYTAKPHQSLRGGWLLLETLPKKIKYREWPKRRNWFGFYIPWGEPRPVPERAIIHESALKHMEVAENNRLVNLPAEYLVEKLADNPKAKSSEQNS
jgi:uncharacterized protein (DUF2235 family)